MSNKERYIEWVAQQEYVPITMQPWWMDAVCAGKTWDVLFATDPEGHILGAMPYLLRKRARFRYILMPQLTHIGGIWVCSEVTGDRWKTAEVCRQIKEQLDKMHLAYYYQQYLPGSLCVDAMRGLGCKIREHVTYRVDDLSDMEALTASFSKNKQRQLKKADALHAERTMDIEDFYRFHTQCLAACKRKCSFTREFLLVLERKARRAKQCQILSICNESGQVLAAAFLIWDKHYLYYLIPAFDPAFGDSGASTLLVLEAMKFAREKQVRFEFGAPTDKDEIQSVKQFGPTEMVHYSVEKSYRWWSFILSWLS